jgi:hypothetical protein
MSSVVKLLFLMAVLGPHLSAQARDVYILVIGESSAASCNEKLFGEVEGVMQIGLDGKQKPARDPMDWSDCKGGSVWIPLGQALIRQGLAQKVIFMPVALAGARTRDWSDAGRGAALLKRAIDTANAKQIRFDYAFLQQGFSDSASDGASYRSDLRKLVRSVSLQIKVGRWLVAQGSGCTRAGSSQVASAHEELARAHQLNRFAGPDFSTFDKAELRNACTFAAAGQQKAALCWLASMKRADEASSKFQKESLLYYFK